MKASGNNSSDHEIRPLDQLVREIDQSLAQAPDTALPLDIASLAGLAHAEQRQKYILFSIGSARLAVSVSEVAEIGDLPVITRLPKLPSWVLGIINVRSEIISVIDLPAFLGWNAGETGRGGRMVILRSRGIKAALRMDQIVGTHNRGEETETVSENPLVDKNSKQLLPEGIVHAGDVHYVIDCEALLASERFVKILP